MRTDRIRSLPLWLAVAAAAALALAPGCQDKREGVTNDKDTACTACHGDPNRAGSALERAAPPLDTQGNTDPSFPGVGAHQIHLTAGKTHAAIACTECHVVPKAVADVGHADGTSDQDLVFGTLAKTGGRSPAYDAANRRCSDTYCHRGSDATWASPRSSDEACGSCHGLPPPAPHPQSSKCHTCHGDVIGESGFVNPALHVDGTVQREQGKCDSCHGSDGVAAPPQDLSGNTLVTALGVGAHRVHLAGGDSSRPVQCSECHTVPENENDPGHRDTDLPAEVAMQGVAASDNRVPVWDRKVRRCADAWCHSPSAPAASPQWTSDAGRLPCTGCHGAPPPAPHPQMTDCSRCHGAVVNDDDKSIKDKARHVDGTVDVLVPEQCNGGCHGSTTSAAPPTGVAGNTATTFPGVGAHQAHLVGSGRARKVQCAECHIVPAKWDDKGHADTLAPAELTFSGVATTGGAAPVYTTGGCEKTYCHGASFPFGDPSGGTVTTPIWTKVDGTQAPCGGCHGLPPPPPHAKIDTCSMCHKNVDSSLNFLFPDTHVDGLVTGAVP